MCLRDCLCYQRQYSSNQHAKIGVGDKLYVNKHLKESSNYRTNYKMTINWRIRVIATCYIYICENEEQYYVHY